MSQKGHEERFLPPGLSAGFGFSKKTFAGTRGTEKLPCPPLGGGGPSRFGPETALPATDPGRLVAHRWRKRFFTKLAGDL
jgi:hypothetical protein